MELHLLWNFRKGANVGLGTDGAASNNNLDLLAEMRTCALLQKAISQDPTVIPAQQALKLATLVGLRPWVLKSGGFNTRL